MHDKQEDVPTIKSEANALEGGPTDVKTEAGPVARGQRWAPETELTYTTGNKVAGITSEQSSQLRSLFTATIARLVPRALMTVNAFPSKPERPDMFLEILVEQATQLRLNDIVLRLLDDSVYAQHMIQIVCLHFVLSCCPTDRCTS